MKKELLNLLPIFTDLNFIKTYTSRNDPYHQVVEVVLECAYHLRKSKIKLLILFNICVTRQYVILKSCYWYQWTIISDISLHQNIIRNLDPVLNSGPKNMIIETVYIITFHKNTFAQNNKIHMSIGNIFQKCIMDSDARRTEILYIELYYNLLDLFLSLIASILFDRAISLGLMSILLNYLMRSVCYLKVTNYLLFGELHSHIF